MDNEEGPQRLGEGWIRVITEGEFDRLRQYCLPEITSRLLLPHGLVTLTDASKLAAEYRAWFGSCINFHVEQRRVVQVGDRLGIFYRLRLQDQGDWYAIEQQLYCTMKDGRVEKLNLVCSGFQPVAMNDQTVSAGPHKTEYDDPARDGLLEFYTEPLEIGSTCAALTPMIKSKLRDLQSGQVLEVRVNDPSAQGDVEAWSRLSGNELLKVNNEGDTELRFFVKKK